MLGRIAGAALVAAAFIATGGGAVHGTNATIDISLLSLAAWNGELEASIVDGRQVGGAAELAARFTNERAATPNTLLLGTGNSFGTSPPISNLFDDEPAVKVMNALRFDADGLGNDNFDHGTAYLQRLMTMADYPFLAANLENLEGNLSGVRAYRIFEVGGVKVAVIGVVDPTSPLLVFPGNFGTINVSDPAVAAFKAREAAQAEGAEVFVLITEMTLAGSNPPAGPLIDLAGDVFGFDAVLGSGVAANFTTTINGAVVVASQERGQAYARTTLQFDPAARKVVASSAEFVQPVVTGEKSGLAISQMVLSYHNQLAGRLSEVIAESAIAIDLTDVCGNIEARSCESLTGNVVTDALRLTYGTDIALLNSGALRSSLTCPAVDGAGDFCAPFQAPPFPITEGQVQAVLPFANVAVVVSITGAELKAMLENGVGSAMEESGRFPQISGFCFWYEAGRQAGSRVTAAVLQAADGSCTGAAIEFSAATSLTLATNDYIAAGGDEYPVPAAAVMLRDRMDNVLSRYLAEAGLLSPQSQGRITCVGTGCPAVVSGVSAALPAGQQIRPPSTGEAGLR